jgi:hypothetical protein
MEGREAYWQRHIERLEKEGLSKTEYCKRHGLSVKSLYRWQRKLSGSGIDESITADQKNPFVAIQLKDVKPLQPSPFYVIHVGTHMRIEMLTLPSPLWLSELWQSLEGGR